ncbi:MAG: shikimate dehydrogenase [Planctomycetes bacterium]|nr:shikimate dehydrogenase [Planctomycetota bacterium]
MLCIPITATTTEDFLTDMRSASELADIDVVELRLDYINNIRIPDVEALIKIKEKTIPVIATCRPEREGGRFTGAEADRIALLEKAAELGAEYVDVEHDAVDKFTRRSGTKLIASYHNFTETPSGSELSDLYDKLSSSGADIVKIVTLALKITDNLRIFKLLEQASKPIIALCMGEPGQISRVLAPKYGGFLTFASLGEGRESAPGQLSARELLDVYNFRAIDHDTDIYGLIGNPVAHSMGPVLHNTCFQAEDINAVYLPFRVEDISSFINGFKTLNVSGYSVTIPHKQAIMGLLDELDALAASVGAVNTVVNRGGRLKGYNTDSTAATKVIEEGLAEDGTTLKGKKVTIVGAGGAARAVAFGLKQKKAKITVVNRTEARAEALAGDLGCGHKRFEELVGLDTEILVNCTSVGMHPNVNDMPVPADVLRPGMWVFDAVYNPPDTRLLREAAARGCRTLDGVKMFVLQAAQQFEMWTGRPAPVQPMEGIIRFRLAAMK